LRSFMLLTLIVSCRFTEANERRIMRSGIIPIVRAPAADAETVTASISPMFAPPFTRVCPRSPINRPNLFASSKYKSSIPLLEEENTQMFIKR
jgi:hypothetical protein